MTTPVHGVVTNQNNQQILTLGSKLNAAGHAKKQLSQ
jgi:hypothetical protein